MHAAIFIDGGYLEQTLKQEFGKPRINFASLSSEIIARLGPSVQLLRTYYYHCLPYQSNPPTGEESLRYAEKRGFFQKLECLPQYQVKFGKLARRGPDSDGKYYYEQKLVDTLLSIDVVRLAATRQITHAAILTGDSDLIPAVEVAKDSGVIVCLVHGSQYHNDLWRVADMRCRLDQALINSTRL
jgi:uncharacterized LabA/DUF88 family protein